MKFSARTLYGLKAILVLAGRYGEGSLSVSQIAKKENISVAYLEQILNALKKKDLVKSVRGPQGGYVLAEKPADISLEDLFYALESKPEAEKLSSEDESAIANVLFWQKLYTSIQTGLSKITLKDILDEARTHKKSKSRSSNQTFHI